MLAAPFQKAKFTWVSFSRARQQLLLTESAGFFLTCRSRWRTTAPAGVLAYGWTDSRKWRWNPNPRGREITPPANLEPDWKVLEDDVFSLQRRPFGGFHAGGGHFMSCRARGLFFILRGVHPCPFSLHYLRLPVHLTFQ